MIYTEDNCIVKDYCTKKDDCPHQEPTNPCPRFLSLYHHFNHTMLPKDNVYLQERLVCEKDDVDRKRYEFLKDIQQNIVSFVHEGKNLLIFSPVTGNGKTAWAKKLLRSYIYKTWPGGKIGECRALFISVPKLLAEAKKNINNESEYYNKVMEYLKTAELVVWDEITQLRPLSDFEKELLYYLINEREENKKSNIYTTNINSLEEVYVKIGDRLASRVLHGTIVKFEGKDRR